MTPRYCTPRNNQVIPIIASDGCHILMEQVGTPTHRTILNGKPCQYWTPIWPHITIVHCPFVSKLVPTRRTEQARTGIRGTTTEALHCYNLLSSCHIIDI